MNRGFGDTSTSAASGAPPAPHPIAEACHFSLRSLGSRCHSEGCKRCRRAVPRTPGEQSFRATSESRLPESAPAPSFPRHCSGRRDRPPPPNQSTRHRGKLWPLWDADRLFLLTPRPVVAKAFLPQLALRRAGRRLATPLPPPKPCPGATTVPSPGSEESLSPRSDQDLSPPMTADWACGLLARAPGQAPPRTLACP